MSLLTNLIFCYELDEASGSAIDSGPNSMNLTENGTIGTAAGLFHTTARTFSASAAAQYFSHVTNSNYETGNIDYTLAVWIYANTLAFAGGIAGTMAKGDASFSAEYYLGYITGSNTIYSIFKSPSTQTTINDGTAGVTTGAWFWILAETTNGVNINLFLNNNALVPVTHTAGSNASSFDYNLGRMLVGATPYYFDGRMQQAAMWKRTLSSGEKSQLYNNRNGLAFSNWVTASSKLAILGVG